MFAKKPWTFSTLMSVNFITSKLSLQSYFSIAICLPKTMLTRAKSIHAHRDNVLKREGERHLNDVRWLPATRTIGSISSIYLGNFPFVTRSLDNSKIPLARSDSLYSFTLNNSNHVIWQPMHLHCHNSHSLPSHGWIGYMGKKFCPAMRLWKYLQEGTRYRRRGGRENFR